MSGKMGVALGSKRRRTSSHRRRSPRRSSRRASKAFFWASTASLVLILPAGLKMHQYMWEKIRKENESAAKAALGMYEDLADRGLLAGANFDRLIARAQVLFADSSRIKTYARHARDLLRKKGYMVDTLQIIEGGVDWAEQTRHTSDHRREEKPSFAEYCTLYTRWREQGKSHEEMLAQLVESPPFPTQEAGEFASRH
jgi:hypothetical protein